MPVPAFGFSAGDFLAVIGLIKKISKALKKTGGASSEFQDAIIELKSLKRVLRHLEALEPTPENENHINAIRGMALACQLPLRDFLVKLEKYEASLGPYSDQRWYRGFKQKSKWAVAFGEDVEKVRAVVASKAVSINLLLTLSVSKSVTESTFRLEQDLKKGTSQILSKAVEHESALEAANHRLSRIDQRLEESEINLGSRVDAISSTIYTTQNTVVSLRSMGQQLLDFVRTFPKELRQTLEKILQSNWQIYQLLLSLQQSPSPCPTNLLDSNIRFEDALGEVKELPYEYFRHWEPFEGFLRATFRNKPGESKILRGQYLVLDENRGRTVIEKEHWTRSIDQGARISMSMMMSRLRRPQGRCPRPSCIGKNFSSCEKAGLLKCKACNLKFFVTEYDLAKSLHHTALGDNETLIFKQQKEEDLQIYGDRPEPSDDVEVDEEDQLSRLPPKRTMAEFHAGLNSPAEASKESDTRTYNHPQMTTMDWNAGESPLLAWLNQSAFPATPLVTNPAKLTHQDSESLAQDRLNEEKKEVELFKNIKLENEEESQDTSRLLPAQHQIADLEFSAQIYYRNIEEKYPKLPHFLTARLAVANHMRSRRLQSHREGVRVKERRRAAKDRRSELRERKRSSLPQSSTLMITDIEPIGWFDAPLSNTQQEKVENYRNMVTDVQDRGRPDSSPTPGEVPRYAEGRSSNPGVNFWTKRLYVSRSRSRESHLSSINSQLHWSEVVDTTYQSPEVLAERHERESSVGSHSSRGLFPAPVHWHDIHMPSEGQKKLSLDCELCGKLVHVERRRDWQNHVLKDLQPYVCTYEDCKYPEQQYRTIKGLLRHMAWSHELDDAHITWIDLELGEQTNMKCLFCGEQMAGEASRGPHLGAHMEEIAFSVIPKAYEDWEFYSDSSSSGDCAILSSDESSLPCSD